MAGFFRTLRDRAAAARGKATMGKPLRTNSMVRNTKTGGLVKFKNLKAGKSSMYESA